MESVDNIFSYGIVWQQIMEEISYAGSPNSGGRKLSKRLIVFGGLFLLVLILLGSAVYFITRDKSPQSDEVTKSITLPKDQEISATPTPVEETSVTPEKSGTPSKSPSKAPTPSGSSAKSDVSIAVQNGSGVSGAAADAAEVLRTAGFTISSTGNAESTDHTDVTIRIKSSMKSHLSAIEKALSDDYTVGSTSTDLPESTTYDVLVIIGK